MTDNTHSEESNGRETTRRAVLTAAATTAAGSAGCLSVSTPADVAETTEMEGNVGYFVGSPWLTDHRDDVTALDARPRRLFREERIYGARHVPLDDISAQTDPGAGLIPDTDAVAAAFGDLGVGRDDDVIVYGDSVGSRVTRTVFALQALGHRGEIQVLNGGFDAWTGRVGTGSDRAVAAAEYEPQPRPELWVTREWLADRVGSFNRDGPGLVDVRVPEAYLGATGADALDPGHDRHGHLPGATGVHWLGNVAGRRLDQPGDLFELYTGDAGLDPETTVVVYGDGNVNPTQTWVTLRAIGFDDVRLYDGGFDEWANVAGDRGRYPVETKTSAVVETEGEAGGTDGGDFSCTG